MTKKELLDKIKDYPEDSTIWVYTDIRDSKGMYHGSTNFYPQKVSFISDPNTIIIITLN